MSGPGVAVMRCLRLGRCGSTSPNALTLTVQVHSVWICFRDGYSHRESRRDALVNGRTLFGFGVTGFGVVSAQDIHIGCNDSACHRSSNPSPLRCTALRVTLGGDIHATLTESMHRVLIGLRSGCPHASARRRRRARRHLLRAYRLARAPVGDQGRTHAHRNSPRLGESSAYILATRASPDATSPSAP